MFITGSIFSPIEEVVEILLHFPEYILYGIETVINLILELAETLLKAADELLPGLPEYKAPELIHQINWFFPIGGLITIAGPIVAGYITFLSVRFIFKFIGSL